MRKSLLCIALAGGLLMGSSCVNLTKIKSYPPVRMEVDGRYMVRSGSELDVDIDMELPAVYTNTHTGLLVYPVLVAGGNEAQLPPMVIDGRKYERFNYRQQTLDPAMSDKADERTRYRLRGTTAEYHTTVDYAEWMKDARLYADLYAGAYTKREFLGRFPVNGGMLDLTGFVDFTQLEKYYYTDPLQTRVVVGGQPDRTEKLTQFAVGSSQMQIDPRVGNAVSRHIEGIIEDPETLDYLVTVVVSNSPEGSLATNKQLGQARAEALRGFLLSTGVPADKITFSVNDEGWDELLAMLPGLGLQNQTDIERLIRNTADPDQREALIRRNHPADYQRMLSQAYPSLRYGKMTVATTYKGAPGKVYYYTFGDLYSGRFELNSFVVSDDTPLDVYATNAQMLDAVKAGELARALELAERIPNRSLPEFIYSNKGMVMLEAGRKDEAKALLYRAPSIPEACYNLGVLQLLDGEYDRAADNLAAFSDLNSAVGMLYAGRDLEARDILLMQEKSPERDYLLAIAYARLGRGEEAVRLLSGAIALRPALRGKAAVEPDFNPAEDKAGFATVIAN